MCNALVTREQTLCLEEQRPGVLRYGAQLQLLLTAATVPLNPLNYTGSRRTDISQEQRPV